VNAFLCTIRPRLIPEAVYREVVIGGQGRPGALEVAAADWIEARAIAASARLQPLPSTFGQGERETIVLAQAVSADVVIMDEAAGQRELLRRSLHFIGTVGVLQQAKLQRLIPLLKPELDGLRHYGLAHRLGWMHFYLLLHSTSAIGVTPYRHPLKAYATHVCVIAFTT
jgi:predicted nucleic acid-binding protein